MIYEYSGYLLFRPLTDQKRRAAKALVAQSGLELFLEPNALEFEYAGRDTNRKIVRLLSRLAEIIHDADGEIICTTEKENTNPDYEFYSIKHGKLYRQIGRIIRDNGVVHVPLESSEGFPEQMNDASSVRRFMMTDETTTDSTEVPCVMVIFGASNDLTKERVIPALYNLECDGLLPENFTIVGIARTRRSHHTFRQHLSKGIRSSKAINFDLNRWIQFLGQVYYLPGDALQAGIYQRLQEFLTQAGKDWSGRNYLYYFATPPDLSLKIIQNLKHEGFLSETEGRWRRVIIEKPFGRALDSAQRMNGEIRKAVNETQIYRIDHYFGKETVRNIPVFRFANGIFESSWNRDSIDHVQITVAEEGGIERRGKSYNTIGALRDMIPNHLFLLLSLIAMEPPTAFDADALCSEQVKVFRAIRDIKVQTDVVRGQYDGNTVSGEWLPAYRAESNVPPDSNTETFIAMKLFIDNCRWDGVPFYLRTGKRLPKRVAEIAVQFKPTQFSLFGADPSRPNWLVLRIQPDAGISLHFEAKEPGPDVNLREVAMQFRYTDAFETTPRTDYEKLLYDCIRGDATLFRRADAVEAAWGVLTPVLEHFANLTPQDFPNYAAGTWGPKAAKELLTNDGRAWREI